ncbi:hypothetical protein BJX70DRAFT_4453 [Aspergillus crustosus]
MFSQTLRRAAAQSARSPLAGRYAIAPHVAGYTANTAIKITTSLRNSKKQRRYCRHIRRQRRCLRSVPLRRGAPCPQGYPSEAPLLRYLP